MLLARSDKDIDAQATCLKQLAQLECYANLPDKAVETAMAAQQLGGDCDFWCQVIGVSRKDVMLGAYAFAFARLRNVWSCQQLGRDCDFWCNVVGVSAATFNLRALCNVVRYAFRP